ncbi:hypothetical protein ACFOY4_20780 [Actinomadura syzygii]|uniref:RNA polymerase alpha subunit C-terminal domain-containing protein n=1 Tax=Actinomadura syzygii TaxID=1427538 RepID=A0A5D0TPI0_9ACTN|nr:hypothetical protein [Actinomadura syzygii]TYC07310.1 hypothetical protein FXF65_43340 [Actinomadura syzygii]
MNDAHSGKAGGVSPDEHGEHGAGYAEIGLECPVSCLGVRTVGDLVQLLAEAGRAAGLPAAAGHAGGGLEQDERVTLASPIGRLELSGRVLAPLRRKLGKTVTVGQVVALLHSGGLAEVRGIGARRIGEIETALIAAGFQVRAGRW